MPEKENSSSDDKNIEFVVKLNEFTQSGKIKWRLIAPSVAMSGSDDTRKVLGAFATTYNGQELLLVYIRRTYDVPMYQQPILFGSKAEKTRTVIDYTLNATGQYGYSLFSMYDVEGLRDLVRAVKRQLFDPDAFIEATLADSAN